jgi:cyclohexyl-isocyanide hydratase
MDSAAPNEHLQIGALIFSGIDQFDFTGPFEVLSRLPHSTFHVVGKDAAPIRDMKGLILTPEKTLWEAPPLDVLVVPGGAGQVELMEDDEVLAFIRQQANSARIVFSVCTGALTVAAAGLLKGVKSTTHWGAFHLLERLGAIPVNERVVVDDKYVSAAGVSSGIDAALRVAALLRGERVAQEIQLYMQYTPEPPFTSGTPETAPPEVLASAQKALSDLAAARLAAATRVTAKWKSDKGTR